MRSSKKRKIAGLRMKAVCVVVTEESRVKLDRIAGPASLGETVEKLIEREYARRERRMATESNSISS